MIRKEHFKKERMMNMDRDCYYAFIGTNSVRGSRGIYTLRIDAASGAAEVVSHRLGLQHGKRGPEPGREKPLCGGGGYDL